MTSKRRIVKTPHCFLSEFTHFLLPCWKMPGRVVVVTGATGAVGRAVVGVFQRAGDQVVSVSRSAQPYGVDLTDEAAVQEVFARIRHDHGKIDVLAHVAGAFMSGGLMKFDVWSQMIAINLYAAVHSIRAVLPDMKARGAGRIIAVGSRSGAEPGVDAAAYSASKAALHTLVRTAAINCASSGVTCNAVLPGTIDTEANRGWGSPEQVATWVKPESVAAAMFWLASDAAGDVNGALLPVYGHSLP